jgi:iron complex outermembrane recepter protein
MEFASHRTETRVLGIAAALFFIAATAHAQVRQFDIPTLEAVQAIPEFARQAGIQIIAPASGLEGVITPALRGNLELRNALMVLLEGTDLEIASDDGSVITLRRRQPSPPEQASRSSAERMLAQAHDSRPDGDASGIDAGSSDETGTQPEYSAEPLETLIVTGTRIKGTQPASPLVTITNEDMRLAGHANLGEVVRALPQNFVGGQNPGVTQGATGGGFSNQNVTGASSLNLRGLGPDATLTLLNGARLPYDGFFQATDVAMVPLAAIERMEVLLDGASAIYGSDAVGGVANIILRRDLEGLEVSARVGRATSGGNRQTQYTAVGGTNWHTGGVLLSAETTRTGPIYARHRGYLSYLPNQNVRIHPEINQKGGLLSAYQNLGTAAELAIDAFFTERRMRAFDQQTPLTFADDTKSTVWGVAPTLRFDLDADWSVSVRGFYGRNERDGDFTLTLIPTGQPLIESSTCYCNEALSLGIEVEGPVFELPGGSARLSAGAGYRENTFSQENPDLGTVFISGTRRSRHGFAEINLPLVSGEQNVPGMTRLIFNGAVRHEDYGSRDFGSVTTPKIGVLWGLTSELDFRASWGKSFKTPTLVQQNQRLDIALSPAALFGVDAPPEATVLRTLGGNPELGPERAETLTAGFVLRPSALPDLHIELNAFHIDYTDRVTTPITPFTAALSNPAFGDFVILNPTVEQQDETIARAIRFIGSGYDPDNVVAIVFNHNTNVARQKVKGFDLSADYSLDFAGGRLAVNGTTSWLDSERRLTPLSPSLETSGVVYFPASFRARGGLSWTRSGVTLAGHINYIDGVDNTNVMPNVSGDSMTTVDAVIDYRFDDSRLGGIRINLAVNNLFNRRPPFLQPVQDYLVNYDSTNYSALGRVISATVSKEF